jgi:hypothetical protein
MRRNKAIGTGVHFFPSSHLQRSFGRNIFSRAFQPINEVGTNPIGEAKMVDLNESPVSSFTAPAKLACKHHYHCL